MPSEFAAIPEPQKDIDALYDCVSALKMSLEALIGVRGTDASTAVTREEFNAMTFRAPAYNVADLPPPSSTGFVVYVKNESGGAVLAFSDGTKWRRVTDRVVVS